MSLSCPPGRPVLDLPGFLTLCKAVELAEESSQHPTFTKVIH